MEKKSTNSLVSFICFTKKLNMLKYSLEYVQLQTRKIIVEGFQSVLLSGGMLC